MMQVPSVKTILKYRKHKGGSDFEFDYIVVDLLDEDDDFEITQMIRQENPYWYEDETLRFECHRRDDSSYVLEGYDPNYKVQKFYDVWVENVLEFNGRYFKLEQLNI